MLRIKNLKKYFGGVKAVDDASFEINKNQITGLIGPNGAGKSTIFNIISGFEKEDSGKVYFEKKDITSLSPEKKAREGISRVFQKSRLFDNLSVYENLLVSIDEENTNFFKSLIKKNKISKEHKEEIDKTLHLFEIEHIKNHKCSDLSFGQKRLVEFARAVIRPHKLLILDEPVAGVSPQLRNKIMDILKKLKRNGETILLIEHDMIFTFNICDKIFVLEKGKVIASGTPAQIKNNKKVLEAYLGD